MIIKRTKTILLLFILPLMFSIASCNKEDVTEDVLYNLLIKDETGNPYDIFLKSDVDNTGFVPNGSISANGTKKINDLVIAVNYTIRFSAPGDPAEDFVVERTFTSDNNVDDFVLTIKP